jgi:hypothetical protein
MALPGLVAAKNLADVADRERAWDNLGLNMSANLYSSFDADARSYILAVEAVDGQSLELGVQVAINQFVLGCKADGIWTAIKASCILAGARTLTGALVPLVGTAPTNVNFVSGDYARKTGLKSNVNTKFLNSNRPNNADGKDDHHLSAYCTENPTGSFPNILGNGGGQTFLLKNISGNAWGLFSRSAGSSIFSVSGSLGFIGGARSNSTEAVIRAGNVSRTGSLNSNTTNANNTSDNLVFRSGPGNEGVNARLAFYSIGESLDLAKLDARVTDLINAFAAAIP